MIKDNVKVEKARILFRNFSGVEGKFNPPGNRNFCVLLDTKVANRLQEDGWNIRWLEPKEEQEERQAYIQVKVKFETDPSKEKMNPRILLVSKRGKSLLNEGTVNILDWAEISRVDLTFRPYNWDVNGKKGVKAYLKSMAVTIVEDEIEEMYYDVPDAGRDMIGGCGNCEACDGTCGH